MSSIKIPAIDRMAHITNGAKNTQQAIIGIANFDEILHKEIENLKNQKNKYKNEHDLKNDFKFNPNEIQSLVYREGHDER